MPLSNEDITITNRGLQLFGRTRRTDAGGMGVEGVWETTVGALRGHIESGRKRAIRYALLVRLRH